MRPVVFEGKTDNRANDKGLQKTRFIQNHVTSLEIQGTLSVSMPRELRRSRAGGVGNGNWRERLKAYVDEVGKGVIWSR